MTSPRTILVTGGTGFIGQHLVRSLLQEGHRLRLFCRSTAKAESLFGSQVQIFPGDLRHGAPLRRACEGAEIVFHLGGLYEFGPGARRELYAVNREGTRNVMSACWAARVERVVHCSTAGLLGTGSTPIGEAHFPARIPWGCHYKGSKWEAERVALDWFKRGLPVVIASPTAPIGPGDERPTPTGRMVRDLLQGRFPCYTRTGLNIVDVADVTRGLLAVSRRGQPGQRYILGGTDYWLGEFLQEVARVAGIPAPRWVAPWLAVAAAGWTGEWIGRWGGPSSSRFCWETAVLSRKRQFFNLSRAREALDWWPAQDLTPTLAATVAWFRNSLARPADGPGSPPDSPASARTESLTRPSS